MKKIINILYFLLMIFLFYFTKDSNMLLFTMSFSMFIIFSSLFSSISIKDKINKFNNNKYYYSSKKIFKYTIIFISIIILMLMLISYLFSLLINIKGITLVNICMCIYLYTNASLLSRKKSPIPAVLWRFLPKTDSFPPHG